MSALVVNIGSPSGKTLSPYIYGFCGGGLCWGFNENNDFDTVTDAGFQASAALLQPQLIRLNCQQTTGMLQNIFANGVGNPNWAWLDTWINNHSGFFNDTTGRLVFGIGPLSTDTSIPASTFASWAPAVAAHFKAAGQECFWWEMGNENDGIGTSTYVDYYTQISDALLTFNPDYNCGGPVDDYWDDGGNGAAILASVPQSNLKYIVWHAYGGGGPTDLGGAISQAVNYTDISSIRNAVSSAGFGNIPLAINEYNLSLSSGNADFNAAMFSAIFMTGCYQSDSNFGMGAIWDLVNSGEFAAIGNGDNGGNTSIITPQGYYLGYAGQNCGGVEYNVTGIPGSCIVTATTNYNRWCVQIINYGAGDQTFNISFTGAPAAVNPGATQWSMNSSGAPSTQSLSDASSISVPNQSISIVTGTFPGAGPPTPTPTPGGTPTPTPTGTPTPTPTSGGTPTPTPVGTPAAPAAPPPLVWISLPETSGTIATFTGLDPGTPYMVQVQATDANGESVSIPVSVTTSGTAPASPYTLPNPSPTPTPTPTPGGTPTPTPVSNESPQGTLVSDATSTIIDSTGNKWGLQAAPPNFYVVTENGIVQTGISTVITLLYWNHQVYAITYVGSVDSWYVWNGTAWTPNAGGDPRTGATPTPTPAPTPTPTPGGTPTPTSIPPGTTFVDDFTSLSLYDTHNPSAGGTWEPAYWYATDGMAQNDGWVLSPFNPATPINNVYALGDPSIINLSTIITPPVYASACSNQPYVCANMTTATSYRQLNGYFECRMLVPNVPGNGCAFWMMSDASWPPELDVIEIVNTGSWIGAYTVWDLNGTISSTSWTYVEPGGSFDPTSGFHTYGADWQSDTINWYIDRQIVFTAPTPAGYDIPLFPIVGAGAGSSGGWGGAITNNSLLPAVFQVDYVAIWNSVPF